VAVETKFDIPQMYQFHNQKTKDIEVDLLVRVIINDDEISMRVELMIKLKQKI
jgi:hypothetical protein